MAQVTITNLTSSPVLIQDLYASVPGSGTLVFERSGSELSWMRSLQRAIALGQVSVQIVFNADENTADLDALERVEDVELGEVEFALLNLPGMAAPPVAAAGEGRIYFDSALNKFRVSQDGGAFTDLVSVVIAPLTLIGTSNVVQLTVKGAPGQTADLLSLEDSASVVKTRIQPTGNIQITVGSAGIENTGGDLFLGTNLAGNARIALYPGGVHSYDFQRLGGIQEIRSFEGDSATAVAFRLMPNSPYSTPGALFLQILSQTGGTDLFHVTKDGGLLSGLPFQINYAPGLSFFTITNTSPNVHFEASAGTSSGFKFVSLKTESGTTTAFDFDSIGANDIDGEELIRIRHKTVERFGISNRGKIFTNAPLGYVGDMADLKIDGVSRLKVGPNGHLTVAGNNNGLENSGGQLYLWSSVTNGSLRLDLGALQLAFYVTADVDSATAIHASFDSRSYVTAGAKLLQLKNAGVEKFHVDYSGTGLFQNKVITQGRIDARGETVVIAENSYNSGSNIYNGLDALPMWVMSGGNMTDSATAVGVVTGSFNNFATVGAKLHSFRTNLGVGSGTEKAYIDKDGAFSAGAGLELLLKLDGSETYIFGTTEDLYFSADSDAINFYMAGPSTNYANAFEDRKSVV